MDCKLSILYEDSDVLVVNKRAGCIVHGDGRSNERTLADEVVAGHPDIKTVGEPWQALDGTTIYRPGIVHRLDRDTSGVMIVAKTQVSYESLKKQFQNREVIKTYRAFVYGNIKEDSGVIDKPIAKSRKDFRLWSAQPGARGRSREAVTEYSVLKRGEGVVYLELIPKTGRTHQLRVHLKAIHHPIVCDPLYAPNRPYLLGFARTALHAHTITFADQKGKSVSFAAPLPDDFSAALSEMEKTQQDS